MTSWHSMLVYKSTLRVCKLAPKNFSSLKKKIIHCSPSCINYFYIFIIPGEACWWTVHPASKQRSEGEKVRVGDDLILVSVATERYLVNFRN